MKTIRPDTKVGKFTLRLVETAKGYTGVILNESGQRTLLDGDDADDLWRRMHDEVGRASPNFIGYDGALARFRRFFPGGFVSEKFVETEGDYKRQAKRLLEETVPLEAVPQGKAMGPAVAKVFQKTNLLHPTFEVARIRKLLEGPAGDDFVRASARFAEGEIAPALKALDAILRPQELAKWTIVTYLPFLWKPEAHMFLKPDVTREFADRVGHRFARDYEARLNPAVYDSLLDLTAEAERAIASLAPRDRIDVQSFIWVVGSYTESDMSSDAV